MAQVDCGRRVSGCVGGGLTGGTDAGETGEGEGPEVGVVGPAEVGVYAAIRWRRDSCRIP